MLPFPTRIIVLSNYLVSETKSTETVSVLYVLKRNDYYNIFDLFLLPSTLL